MNEYTTQEQQMLPASLTTQRECAASRPLARRLGLGFAMASGLALSLTAGVAVSESVDVEAKLKQLLPPEATIRRDCRIGNARRLRGDGWW